LEDARYVGHVRHILKLCPGSFSFFLCKILIHLILQQTVMVIYAPNNLLVLVHQLCQYPVLWYHRHGSGRKWFIVELVQL
jgi:hypothetical protein